MFVEYTSHVFCNALVHVIYSLSEGQYSYTGTKPINELDKQWPGRTNYVSVYLL